MNEDKIISIVANLIRDSNNAFPTVKDFESITFLSNQQIAFAFGRLRKTNILSKRSKHAYEVDWGKLQAFINGRKK